MINVALALLAGGVVFAALFIPGLLSFAEALVPGILAVLPTYYVLARRTFKQLEAIFNAAAKSLQSQPPKLDLAIRSLENGYALARWQIGVRTQVDSQIGVIYFLQKEFKKAAPYLERSQGFGHWLGTAMLSVIYYKRKSHDAMKEALEIVTKKGKKQGLAWALRAYLLCQIGERDAAQAILVEGVKATKDDPKVKDALIAVQNNKKIKMRAYKEQWYQFHLERPPAQYMQQQVPIKVGKIARRGRW